MADATRPPRMPRWVRISLIVGGIVLLALVVVALVAPGGHGPRLHG